VNIAELREKLLKVVDKETAYDPETYVSGMDGHCFAVAYVVQHYFGGDIVSGRINNERHAWNKLPDGSYVDLTSCQFGGDGFTPLSNKSTEFRPNTQNRRFKQLLEKVKNI